MPVREARCRLAPATIGREQGLRTVKSTQSPFDHRAFARSRHSLDPSLCFPVETDPCQLDSSSDFDVPRRRRRMGQSSHAC